MNVLEKEMIEVLKRLKNDYGVFEIKAEFENEGSRLEELMRLKDIIDKVNLRLILKIGGVEAVSDIYTSLNIGANGIVAPMAESSFAVSKFIKAIEKFVAPDNRDDIEFAINIETINAYKNLDEILSIDNLSSLSSITIGRVDFGESLLQNRSFANSDEMFEYCYNICKKAKASNLKCAVGGAVSLESKSFMSNLIKDNLIDKYETRKVVYHKDGIKDFDKGLNLGIEFELLWLKSKRRFYHRIRNEDEKRIEMIEERIGKR